ncbi:Phosphotransferase KptA/Tpt1 protein [Dioscorea alata]|uniref:Phosphotransferase KptA/Tpt1 protein n=1 Tax=Dioscorea alata TaxID=55571 RepID=A0ACB7WDB1_DIOAL|nr:Phosphotransferase KptA/Tpt1 protein [Dioscorea alata]
MWASASLSLRALRCFASSSSSSSFLLSPALRLSHHFLLLSALSSNLRPSPLMQSSTAQPHPFSSSPLTSSSRGRGRGSGPRDDRSPRGGRGGVDRIDALGRLLTRILRHQASELKLDMRSDGYVRVRDLLMLNVTTLARFPLRSHSVDEVKEAVRRDNKQRFGLLEENGELLIRANQGHTISTISSDSLLQPILSADEVPGMRRDVNVLVFLDVRKALEEGMKLYISDNKVILTEGFNGVVPVKFLEKIETWPGRQLIPFQS